MAIFVKLLFIQVVQREELTLKAQQNWDREIPFSSMRGVITDRNGKKLVTNELAPTLYYMPAQNDSPEEVYKQLTTVLPDLPSSVKEKLKKRDYLVKLAPEAKNITPEQATAIQQMQIKGLYTGVDYIRHYPYGNLLARLLGFTGYDMQGLAGIEYAYNELLTSNAAAIRLFTDAKGNTLPHVDDDWKEGAHGATVQLTIDVEIQQVVERELAQAMLKYDADQALAIAMNPKTGELLALASFPTYDPTNFSEVTPEVYNRNLPVFMTFEPGSTFKIITLSAALEEKLVNLHNDHFYDHGYTIVEDSRLRCWQRRGHGQQTFLEVVENSCNPGFIELGQRLGPTKLMSYIKNFGFGQSTQSNIAGESTGILFSEKAFGPVEQATTAFGQGISVTPIQQVQAVAATINGGKLMQPYIVSKIINSETGEPLAAQSPVVKRTVISRETSALVRSALESVVAKGSGRQAYRDGLRIGGKTGTAQKVEKGRYKDGDYIVSFIGFAPANDPEILVYVAIDRPTNHLQFGGVIAAPIVGQIIEDVAPILNLPKATEQLEREYVWGDDLTIRVDNFVGLERQQVLEHQYPFRISWHGEGTRIIDQLPRENGVMKLDETLHLYLAE